MSGTHFIRSKRPSGEIRKAKVEKPGDGFSLQVSRVA